MLILNISGVFKFSYYLLPSGQEEWGFNYLTPTCPSNTPTQTFLFLPSCSMLFSKHDFWVKKKSVFSVNITVSIIYSWATNCIMSNFLSYMSCFFFNGLEVIIFILIWSTTNSSKFSVKVLKLLLASQTSKVIYHFRFLFWDFPLGFSILLSCYGCVVWELSALLSSAGRPASQLSYCSHSWFDKASLQ